MVRRSLGQSQLIALVIVAILATALPATVIQSSANLNPSKGTTFTSTITALPTNPYCPLHKSFNNLRIISSEELPKTVTKFLIHNDVDIARAVKLLLGNGRIIKVIAVRHRIIVNGYPGTLLAIGVASDKGVMIYYRYTLPNHHVRNVAYLYTIKGRYAILQKIYVNGKVSASSCPHECSSDWDCEDQCGPPTSGGCVLVCCKVNWMCSATCICSICKIPCNAGPTACLICMIAACWGCVSLCCVQWGSYCQCKGTAP